MINWIKRISLVMLVALVLMGCQNPKKNVGISEPTDSVAEESQAQISDEQKEDLSAEEGAEEYEIESLLPVSDGNRQYDWVIFQNGRSVLRQSEADAINGRLQELDIEASIAFHIVTMEEYVTPQVLSEVYKQLEGQMDFVSIGPALCAFDMDKWQENFIELSEELKNGQLNQFYTAVPEVVWQANQIDDRIYSFSNMTQVLVHGYTFEEEYQEKYGQETLINLQQANGIENEEPWQEMYNIYGESDCLWTGLYWGKPTPIEENPYLRSTMSKLANGYEDLYFTEITDDIRYNIETGEFEWLLESETYSKVQQKVLEFYEKGYLRCDLAFNSEGVLAYVSYNDEADLQTMVTQEGEKTGELWVPSWQKARITKEKTDRNAIYSLVYCKAESGWEEMLNVLGFDETIADILNNHNCDMTISAVVYNPSKYDYFVDLEESDNPESQYGKVKAVYEAADPDPLAGFVFNPYPIREEWEEYNQKMTGYANVHFYDKVQEEDDIPYANLETIETVLSDMQSMKEEAHIDLILEELSNQYTKWKNQ